MFYTPINKTAVLTGFHPTLLSSLEKQHIPKHSPHPDRDHSDFVSRQGIKNLTKYLNHHRSARSLDTQTEMAPISHKIQPPPQKCALIRFRVVVHCPQVFTKVLKKLVQRISSLQEGLYLCLAGKIQVSEKKCKIFDKIQQHNWECYGAVNSYQMLVTGLDRKQKNKMKSQPHNQ